MWHGKRSCKHTQSIQVETSKLEQHPNALTLDRIGKNEEVVEPCRYLATPLMAVYHSLSWLARKELWWLKSENGEAAEQVTRSECHPAVPLQEYL
jgi:hypothetical protein